MKQNSYSDIIREQTERALWEVRNVIDCIPDSLWNKQYCSSPCWQHAYHMLHSLDLWFINPRDRDFAEPPFHVRDLNNLDATPEKELTREALTGYYDGVKIKILRYLGCLRDEELLRCPPGCEYTRFTLILAQFRHLHSHMGMLMGFIIGDTGLWPRVVGLERDIPCGEAYQKYF